MKLPRVFKLRRKPCSSCPYRCDVPSAIWAKKDYDKLRGYDGSTVEQAVAGATALFRCHQAPDRLCAGWVGCHDMYHSLAMRIHWSRSVKNPAVFDYVCPVPLFASGAEAADHGMRDMDNPSPEAVLATDKIVRIRKARGEEVEYG